MGEQDTDQVKDARETDEQDNDGRTPTEKPVPDEEDKEKAAEMMEAYRERPTLVLPGTGGWNRPARWPCSNISAATRSTA